MIMIRNSVVFLFVFSVDLESPVFPGGHRGQDASMDRRRQARQFFGNIQVRPQ